MATVPPNELISYEYKNVTKNWPGCSSTCMVSTSEGNFTLQSEIIDEHNPESMYYTKVSHSLFGEQRRDYIECVKSTLHTSYSSYKVVNEKNRLSLVFYDTVNDREVARFYVCALPFNKVLATIKKNNEIIFTSELDTYNNNKKS